MRTISKSSKKSTSPMRVMLLLMDFILTYKFSIIFLSAFAILLFGVITADTTFRIQQVIVHGDHQKEPFKGLDSIQGKHIWSIDADHIDALRRLNPAYSLEQVEKQYPSTLVISLKQRLPGAYLAIDSGYLLLSTQGVVLEKTRDKPKANFPIISFYQRIPFSLYAVGSVIHADEIEDSLYFLSLVQQVTKERVDSIDIVSYNMLGLYTGSKEFFFSSEKDREVQKYQLEQSVKQFRIDGTAFTRLDLRFDKPIVKF